MQPAFETYVECKPISVLPKIAPFAPGSDAFYPGDYFTVQCSIIHGDHPLLLYWAFNGMKLNEKNIDELGVTISKMGSRSSVLTIESVKHFNAGNYTCYGKNKAGVTNYTAELIVNGLKCSQLYIKCSFKFHVLSNKISVPIRLLNPPIPV